MIKTPRLKILAALVGVSLAGVCGTAQALVLTYGDSYYLGRIVDGIPASPAEEVGYINSLLSLSAGAAQAACSEPAAATELCDRVSSSVSIASAPGAVFVLKNESGANTFDITSGSVKYILGKYDQDQAGSYVWYNATGFSGFISMPGSLGTCGNSGCGLSHFSLFNSGGGDLDLDVPEPGSLALLGLGLIGLGFVRRRQTA